MRGVNSAALPPTIQALLATRIDRLEPEERTLNERASIEGRFSIVAPKTMLV